MTETTDNLDLAIALTVAWLGNSHTRPAADDVPAFLRSMHDALGKLGSNNEGDDTAAADDDAKQYTPAVSVRKSLASPDKIISLIDGKPYSSLRRHLTANGLTPDEYRQRYGLKPDYPMVSATYSEARRAMAKAIGLGRKAGMKIENVEQKVEKAMEPVAKAARKGSKAALAAAKEALGTGE